MKTNLVRMMRGGALAASLAMAGTLGGGALQGAQAQQTLRVAMTAGDIPDVTGQPDQGFEGYRFVGYTIYDSLILWDLTRSDREATLTPGLATKWAIDPKDNKRWIFDLRRNVKFHDGSDFNADVVLWNIARLTDEKAPQFNAKQFAAMRTRTINIDRAEKIDDHTVAIVTKEPDSLFYIQMRDRVVEVGPNQLFIVPKGVEHRTVADEEVHLLLIEPAGTPNAGDERTAAAKVAI